MSGLNDSRKCITGRLLLALQDRPAGASVYELCALADVDLRQARLGLRKLQQYELAERVYRPGPMAQKGCS